MPILGKRDSDKKLVLPTSTPEDEAFVTVKSKLLLGDLVVIETNLENQYEQTIAGLANYITDWNFTDEAGNKLPITREQILEFDKRDYEFVTAELNRAIVEANKDSSLDDEQKKTSSASLTAPTPVIPQT